MFAQDCPPGTRSTKFKDSQDVNLPAGEDNQKHVPMDASHLRLQGGTVPDVKHTKEQKSIVLKACAFRFPGAFTHESYAEETIRSCVELSR